jgi:hypothetical protein
MAHTSLRPRFAPELITRKRLFQREGAKDTKQYNNQSLTAEDAEEFIHLLFDLCVLRAAVNPLFLKFKKI